MRHLDASVQFDTHLLATPLNESGEACISVREMSQKHHVHMVFPGGKKNMYWLRQAVASALLKVAQMLYMDGYLVVVEDAYRSLSAQKDIFLHEVSEVKKQYPGIADDTARKMANTFVAGIPILAAHTAASAVDLTLRTVRGKPVDMGCPYLLFSGKAITNCSTISKEAKKNRKILVAAMESAGFSNYPFEYWHFSMGDVCDAYLKHQKKSIYGPVELDGTGKVKLTVNKNDYYTYFS